MKKLATKVPTPNPRPFGEPRKLVLYVEDDADNRQVAEARLAKSCDMVFAVNDREACRALIDHGEKLSIILMDIELQGSLLSGLDLTQLIRGKVDRTQVPDFAAQVPELDTPILFVTAYSQRFLRGELLSAGADAIIQKPVDFVELHTAITRIYLARLGSKR